MTLTTLLLYITLAAVALTAGTYFGLNKRKNPLMSFVQNWSGALFLFSGYVKAVDPLGTAYKMEQYFAEFQATFADTALSFVAPLFPLLNEYAVGFSVFMIVLEIVLGVMLILGTKPKLTAWLFFLIVAFFTVLTGFTYLTGYVPSGVNFFAFGDWGPYAATNMKVTDCGCFGDFLKLEPRTSFFKDIFLLGPALFFILAYGKMHQLFTPTLRAGLVGLTAVVVLFQCLSNFVWDIPTQDFRPFKVGADIAATKLAEEEAAASVQTIGYRLTNKSTGQVENFSTADYLKVYKDYPETDWEVEPQVTEPAIVATKISDFEVSSEEGEDMIPDLLADPGNTFVIVAYKLKGEAGNWNEGYLADWKEDIQPLAQKALAAGDKVVAMTKFNDDATINDFRKTIGADYPFWRGDDIMLKTIIRSNPGVVLFRGGKIVGKWHHDQLPEFTELMAKK